MVGTSRSNNNSSNIRTSHTSAATGNSSKLCSLGYDVDDTDDMDDIYYSGSGINSSVSNKNSNNNDAKKGNNIANKSKTNKSKNNKKDVTSS